MIYFKQDQVLWLFFIFTSEEEIKVVNDRGPYIYDIEI